MVLLAGTHLLRGGCLRLTFSFSTNKRNYRTENLYSRGQERIELNADSVITFNHDSMVSKKEEEKKEAKGKLPGGGGSKMWKPKKWPLS